MANGIRAFRRRSRPKDEKRRKIVVMVQRGPRKKMGRDGAEKRSYDAGTREEPVLWLGAWLKAASKSEIVFR